MCIHAETLVPSDGPSVLEPLLVVATSHCLHRSFMTRGRLGHLAQAIVRVHPLCLETIATIESMSNEFERVVRFRFVEMPSAPSPFHCKSARAQGPLLSRNR